jgi:hypothetical protein
MYTSTLLVALLSVPGAADTPTWSSSYSAACKECESAKKPLAVFLGSGKTGYNKVARDGELSPECRRQLSSGYVCVYIDTSTESGRRLASEFEMPSRQGIVISDRGGSVQAFRHEGDLTNADLNAYLERYASGPAVSTTETVYGARTSFAAAEEDAKDAKDGGKKGTAGPAPHHGHGTIIVGGGYGGCGGGACYAGSCGGGGYSDCGHHGRRGGHRHRGGRCR